MSKIIDFNDIAMDDILPSPYLQIKETLPNGRMVLEFTFSATSMGQTQDRDLSCMGGIIPFRSA